MNDMLSSVFEEALLNHVDEFIFEQLKVNGSHVDVRLHTMISFLDITYGTITQADLQYLHHQNHSVATGKTIRP